MKADLIYDYKRFLAHFLNAGTKSYLNHMRANTKKSKPCASCMDHTYTPSPKKQQGMVSNNKMLIQVLLHTA